MLEIQRLSEGEMKSLGAGKAQELGVGGTEMCSEILGAPKRSDELRSPLGRLLRKVG